MNLFSDKFLVANTQFTKIIIARIVNYVTNMLHQVLFFKENHEVKPAHSLNVNDALQFYLQNFL